MRFSIDMVVPALEAMGLSAVVNAGENIGTFLYADTLASVAPAADTRAPATDTPADANAPRATTAAAIDSRPATLSILPIDAALELDPALVSTRPVLAVIDPETARSQKATATACDLEKLPAYVATSASCDKVCSAVNGYLVKLREWDAEMARAIERGCSTQELLDASEPVIGSYLALSDALYAAVAVTPSFPPIDDMSRSLVENGVYPAEMLSRIERFASSQAWHNQVSSRLDQNGNDLNPCPNMSRIYRLGGNYAAHLVMVRPGPIERWRQTLFDMLADRIGQCLARFWTTSLPRREKGSSFLTAILEDAVHDDADFRERARLFDFPETGVFEVGVIAGAEERGGIAHIVHQIGLGIKSCRIAVIGQRIYVLMISGGKENGKLATIESALFDMVARLHAEIGVSSRFDALENCHMARLEADVALEYGHKNYPKYLALKERNPYLDCVFRFNRYFPCYLVDPYSDTAEFMAKYAQSPNIVNRLRANDRENGTNDYGLLKIYLYCDCSIKQTADIMNMHRNTVIYRLNKIRNEYFIDLDDSDTRLFLHYLFGVLD